MDKRPTILITNNKLHSRMRRQAINREDIMEQTRATLGVSKQALSFGSQRMHMVAGIQSIRLQQDLPQRKMAMELSDKASLKLYAVSRHV
jgi:Zn-dependent peptidase ImmA (M78 family)